MSQKVTLLTIIFIIASAAGLYGVFFVDNTSNRQIVSYSEDSIVDQDGTVLLRQDDIPQSMTVSSESEFGAAGDFTSAELSPNGEWIAFTTTGAAHGGGWLYDIETGEVSAAAFQYGGDVEVLEWSPNGQYVLFSVSTPVPSEQLVLVERSNIATYVEDTSTTVSVSAAEDMDPPASYEFEGWEAPQTLCFAVLNEERCLDAADIVN